MTDGHFTQEQKLKILEYFRKKCPNASCPMCSSEDEPDWYSIAQGNFEEESEAETPEGPPFTMVSAYTPLMMMSYQNGPTPLGMTVPVICFICRRCGYVTMFSSRVLCNMPETQPEPPQAQQQPE